MKNKILLLSCLFSLGTGAYAQGIAFHDNSSYSSGYISEFELISKNTLVNTSIFTEFVWVRETNELPDEWTAAVCDNVLCHAIDIDSAEFSLDQNDSFDFKVNFYPLNNLGRGSSRIRIYAKSDPSVSTTAMFYVHGWGLSVQNESLEGISVYPNPAQTTLYIVDQYNRGLSWQISGMNGQIISEGNEADTEIDVNQLDNGIYVLKLSDGENVYNRRFVKTN